MSTPPRTRPGAPTVESSRRDEAYLSGEQLAHAAGISMVTLARLMSLGLVEPAPNPRRLAPMFSVAMASRLRRMLRLHRDLGVNFTGAAIIVDLVERLEHQPGGPGW
ncbi:MAG TPA: chaperone modulator CbpM [Methylomirabilota bacterium]|nr:chaperone modulator CbpM [Methylomirabilota bacterium]